jgi:hypothetical protein
LPKTTEKTVKLRAMLVPMAGGNGDVQVRVRSGKEQRLDQELKPRDKPVVVGLDIPVDDEFVEIEVDFGERLRFPCGVVLGDPRLHVK